MNTIAQAGSRLDEEDVEGATIAAIYWKIIPLFFLMTFFNYLDRINLGFADLQMNKALGFNAAVFGFGASIFFLGYGNSLFWSLNASFMTGIAAAVSIAAVNMIAQFGGLIGPWLIGLVKNTTGSFSIALTAVAGFLLLAAIMAAMLRVAPKGHAGQAGAR